jgi:hypothetical protein
MQHLPKNGTLIIINLTILHNDTFIFHQNSQQNTPSRPHMVMITRTSLHIIIVFYSTTLMVYHLAKHLFTKSLVQLSLLTSIGLDLRKLILILQRNTFDTKLSLHYRIEHMASNLQVVFFPKVTLHTLET